MRALSAMEMELVAGGYDTRDPFELPPGNPIRDLMDAWDRLWENKGYKDTDGDGDRDMTDAYNTLYQEAVDEGYFDPGRSENNSHEDFIENIGLESGIIDAIQGDDNRPGDD
ncbi:hypothetical protein PQU94_04100 [Asticcacaulis sp. DXS10W]|uniref:Uncharacterized protein n=1 Tax=Asticcacaulis currens TaxID=2984210 RepID=A0ABT5IBU0_9CAUL|nr:hypothetical protein [Asticcacaulis currens]MDC7693462.1 hypothetical protein [Asticcacaulis currens]